MFGSSRKKAINNSVEAVSQLVRTSAAWNGLPAGYWSDAYVLGFLTTTIAIFAELALGKRPPADELGFIIIGTYERLNPVESNCILQRIAQLQQSKDVDYFKATENAVKTIAVTYGDTRFDNDKDVQDAAKLAHAMRGQISPAVNIHAEIGGSLQSLLFHQVVRSRLAPSDSV